MSRMLAVVEHDAGQRHAPCAAAEDAPLLDQVNANARFGELDRRGAAGPAASDDRDTRAGLSVMGAATSSMRSRACAVASRRSGAGARRSCRGRSRLAACGRSRHDETRALRCAVLGGKRRERAVVPITARVRLLPPSRRGTRRVWCWSTEAAVTPWRERSLCGR
jgi:hypothetical protein